MIAGRHKHKLIQGLVMAMGEPEKPGRKPAGAVEDENGDEENVDAGPAEDSETEGDETPEEEETEDVKCARDAALALGMPELSTSDAKAFAEAIRKIAGGY